MYSDQQLLNWIIRFNVCINVYILEFAMYVIIAFIDMMYVPTCMEKRSDLDLTCFIICIGNNKRKQASMMVCLCIYFKLHVCHWKCKFGRKNFHQSFGCKIFDDKQNYMSTQFCKIWLFGSDVIYWMDFNWKSWKSR